jgi:LCP family protein required for cell wall assembly
MKLDKKFLLWLSVIICVAVLLSITAYISFSSRAESVASDGESDAGDADVLSAEQRTPDKLEAALSDDFMQEKDLYNASTDEKTDYSLIQGLTEEKGLDRKLVEDGSINILILGEDKENALFDTIGIVSVSQKTGTIKVIMIPRDTYVKYNKKVLDVLEKAGKIKEPGIFKINYAHHIGPMMKYEGRFSPFTSISFLADIIEEKFNVRVDDYVKINVQGFSEIVDLFGGIDIDVPYRMDYYDPTQGLRIDWRRASSSLCST